MTCSAYVQAFWRSRVASMLVRLSALAFWPPPLPSFWPRAFWKLCGRSSTQLLALPIASSSLSSSFLASAFAFRVVRFLAAPIAAPESAPITVPTTGRPMLSRPRRQPPRHQECFQPCLARISACISLNLDLCRPCFSPRVERNDARFCKSRCQHEVHFMHCRAERLSGTHRRTITRCWRGPIPKARYPLLHRLAGLWQANDVRQAHPHQ